jgi:uncharacterized protein DUF6968
MSLRREDFGEEVAAAEYVFQFADGSERAVKIRVGRPYEDGVDVWACPVELLGFERRYPDIRGSDSMQALSLALSFVWLQVQDFVEKGGKVLDRERHSYSLDELRRILGR